MGVPVFATASKDTISVVVFDGTVVPPGGAGCHVERLAVAVSFYSCNLGVSLFLRLSSSWGQLLIHLGISLQLPSHPVVGRGILPFSTKNLLSSHWILRACDHSNVGQKITCLDKVLARWQGSLEKCLKI